MTNILMPWVKVFENIVPADLRSTILATYDDNCGVWMSALVGGKRDLLADVRDCAMVPLSRRDGHRGRPERMAIDRQLHKVAGDALEAYAEVYPKLLECVKEDGGYELLRYTERGHYLEHVDVFSDAPRTLSCSMALNDDFEGGEWVFFGGTVRFRVPAGAAVMFPSNFMFPHGIDKVTKGTRYSVITWFR